MLFNTVVKRQQVSAFPAAELTGYQQSS